MDTNVILSTSSSVTIPNVFYTSSPSSSSETADSLSMEPTLGTSAASNNSLTPTDVDLIELTRSANSPSPSPSSDAQAFPSKRAREAQPSAAAPTTAEKHHEALRMAALSGDLTELSHYLGLVLNPCSFNEYGATPLHLASRNGQLGVVDMLIRAHHPLNVVTPSGTTPLHYAALNDRTSVVILLLRAGALPALLTHAGETPLRLAAERGSVSAAHALIAAAPQAYLQPQLLRDLLCSPGVKSPSPMTALLRSILASAPLACPPLPRPCFRLSDLTTRPFPAFAQPGRVISPPPRVIIEHFSVPPGFSVNVTCDIFTLDGATGVELKPGSSVFSWDQLTLVPSSDFKMPKTTRFPRPIIATLTFTPVVDPDCVLADVFRQVAPFSTQIQVFEHVRWFGAPIITSLSNKTPILYTRSEIQVFGQWFISPQDEADNIGEFRVYLLDYMGTELRISSDQITARTSHSFTLTQDWHTSGTFWVIVRNLFVHRVTKTRITSSPHRIDQSKIIVVQPPRSQLLTTSLWTHPYVLEHKPTHQSINK